MHAVFRGGTEGGAGGAIAPPLVCNDMASDNNFAQSADHHNNNKSSNLSCISYIVCILKLLLVQTPKVGVVIPKISPRANFLLYLSPTMFNILVLPLVFMPYKMIMYRWVTLWSGQSQCHSIPKEARVFTPPIKKIEFATKSVIQ